MSDVFRTIAMNLLTDAQLDSPIPALGGRTARQVLAETAPSEPDTWRCACCGSDDIEWECWMNPNTGDTSDVETSDYFCHGCDGILRDDEPTTPSHEGHHHGVCCVDAEGDCSMHSRPFADCRSEAIADGGFTDDFMAEAEGGE
jgi:hypothetical protein